MCSQIVLAFVNYRQEDDFAAKGVKEPWTCMPLFIQCLFFQRTSENFLSKQKLCTLQMLCLADS